MRTGVVIVTYNSADKIERCLESCSHLHVVVVDNASRDATCQLVRRHAFVTLIANATNHGFACAVNQGVGALDSDLVMLLNPDTELKTPLDALEAACLEPATGIAAGQLIADQDGRPQRGFTLRRFPQPATLIFEVLGFNRLFPSNPLNQSYRCFDVDLSRPSEVEQPAGAFL
ncbi:MAG TPA: glycosyltransferase, partial [Bryobacteraceae bacterium]|nr:glycosyltransferase [Bryobacteraceae bacterium]